MYQRRQFRVRVLEALDRRVKQFAIREDLWPLRVPHDPLPLDDIVRQALGEEAKAFDVASLRSRTLLQLEWKDGSSWAAWVVVLPSKIKLFCDSSDEESRVLASGGKNEGDESDRIFLELLSDSAGEHFGIEMDGGPPARVRSSIGDRKFLVDVFVNLFELTRMEGAVRQALAELGVESEDEKSDGVDFRTDVELWLRHMLT